MKLSELQCRWCGRLGYMRVLWGPQAGRANRAYWSYWDYDFSRGKPIAFGGPGSRERKDHWVHAREKDWERIQQEIRRFRPPRTKEQHSGFQKSQILCLHTNSGGKPEQLCKMNTLKLRLRDLDPLQPEQTLREIYLLHLRQENP